MVIQVHKLDTLVLKDIPSQRSFVAFLKFCYCHSTVQPSSSSQAKDSSNSTVTHKFLKSLNVDELIGVSELAERFMVRGLQKVVI